MLALGQLYLDCGQAGGTRVVSEAWIHEATMPRTESRFSGQLYGYGWWIRWLGGREVVYAWGYGGQFIFVVPTLRIVVVTTSQSDPSSERQEHLEAIYNLVAEDVIPAVERMGAVTPQPRVASPQPSLAPAR
jgi:CubicO group peptidase (beta-lactamase class C family)